jgi:branched-chain amino acid transport system permease protein
MEMYISQAIHGITYGMLLFLVASGFTLVFGLMNILNVAHVGFYMLGAYFAYTISHYVGSFWVCLVISPILVGILGLLTERFLIRKVHKAGHESELLLTFGLFFILVEAVSIIWGPASIPVQGPKIFEGVVPFLGGKTFPLYRLFIVGFSFLVLLGMLLMLFRTRIGILIRAAVTDADMVDALGTNIQALFTGVFAIGSALAGIAGVIAAPFLSTHPAMGMEMLLDCFVVVVVGGFGSLLGAFLSSLMIGALHSFGILWIPRLAMVFEFLLMAVVLSIRPTGLFGEKE